MTTSDNEPSGRTPSSSLRRLHLGIATGGALVIAAILGLTGYGIWETRRAALTDASRELDNLSHVLAEQTARTFQAIDLILRDMVDTAQDARTSAHLNAYLKQQITGAPQLRALSIIDARGRMSHMSYLSPPPENEFSDRPWFAVHRENSAHGLYISVPVISRTDGRPALPVTRRIKGPHGEFEGIAVGNADIAYFESFYRAIDLGENSSFCLFRTDGALLARHPSSVTIGDQAGIAHSLPTEQQASQKSLRMPLPADGVERLTSLQAVPGFPLVIGVARSEDVVLAGWRTHAISTASRTLGLALIGGLLLVLLMRKLGLLERAEHQLRESERRQAVSQKVEAIGTLAGGIAHDFNNILASILGYCEMAQRAAPASTTLQRYLGNVISAATRGRTLIARIFSFTRTGAGALTPVRVQRAVLETLELLTPIIGGKVDVKIDALRNDLWIMGDPSELQQVVMNLCTNAVQAMVAAGTLTIRLEAVDELTDQPVSSGHLKAGRYVKLSIEDTGRGMDPFILERMFDPFFTTKDAAVGTGLGLTVVHAIVSRWGGALRVKSNIGAGSRFDVYLPRAVASDTEHAIAQPERSPRGAGETIMVVDDEESLVRLNEELLAELGYEPVGFTSSKEAIAEFSAAPHRFDVVFTDQRMPEMTGIELANEIRRLNPATPIVLVSGALDSALERHARAVGICNILAKPLRLAETAAAIAHALGK